MLRLPIIFSMLLLPTLVSADSSFLPKNPMAEILGEIKQLESDREPKCYATASRLEDFMYGTPLTAKARVKKIELQKNLIKLVWKQASRYALSQGLNAISETTLQPVLNEVFSYRVLANGDWEVRLANGSTLDIQATDKRQYSSVAYALRAILAVQQEVMLASDSEYLALTDSSIRRLQEFLDVLTLSTLSLSDRKARITSDYSLTAKNFEQSWHSMITAPKANNEQTDASAAVATSIKRSDFSLLHAIIEQKLSSYAAYNHISNQVFVRNLQVYFARHRWPKDPEIGNQFKQIFTAAMVQYANDLFIGAEEIARERKHALIRVQDVETFSQRFVPYAVNEYEDAIFFPKLPGEQSVTLESYDMDAFRDSGIHWRYLQFAIEDSNFKGTIEPDPFAAELLVENIAQFGVLVLRVAGSIAKEEQNQRLDPTHIDRAMRRIQQRIIDNGKNQVEAKHIEHIVSAKDNTKIIAKTFFDDRTSEVGLDFMHRSSDWLNRLIRGFAMKSETVGQLTIPPAFGGSGVAAEDVDGDGNTDILLLSGLGNRLYINGEDGRFIDITESAGIDWRRPDGHGGEPRQPLIADFDNDGLEDILITYVNDNHRVYRNLGKRKFEDVTATAQLGGAGWVGGPATVFDFNNDGLLDIYITYFGDYLHGVLPTLARRNTNGQANRLFMNQGNFRFKDVTQGSGLANSGWTQAVSHTDLDLDGWQDVVVGNDFGVNGYYKNRGDGTFEDISSQIGTDKPSYTMNIGITDLNNDLFPDIYISNIVTMNKDETYIIPASDTVMKFNPQKLANMRVVEANDLFVSETDDKHLLRYRLSNAVERGYSSTGWSWDADFFDFDNDSDDDLYVVNGMNEFNVYSSENPYYSDPLTEQKRNVYIPVSSRESNVFFINQGGKMQNASRQSGANLLGNSRSVAYLDQDNDGDLDMILNNYHQKAVFYRNNAEEFNNHWIKVSLIGSPEKRTNRDAIGAKIIASMNDGRRVWREIHGSIGYLSVHPKQQYIGLAKSAKTDLTVIWPNGEKMEFKDVAANRKYVIDQRDGSIIPR